jgi:hypothetical protein
MASGAHAGPPAGNALAPILVLIAIAGLSKPPRSGTVLAPPGTVAGCAFVLLVHVEQPTQTAG